MPPLDRALRAVFAPARASRPVPGPAAEAGTPLPEAERRASAALMRVNHAGELAAQALYHGQAAVARAPATRALLNAAARAESDHLAWCETRLQELGARPSLLNPLWYAGSFAIGAPRRCWAIAPASASWPRPSARSSGISTATSADFPPADVRSRAILEAMRADEIAHGATATAAGGVSLPEPVRTLMRYTARVMTGTAYWV